MDEEKVLEMQKHLEAMTRPMRNGTELSKTYGDLFDLLDQNGYLHEGERDLLTKMLAAFIIGFAR